MSTAPDAVSPTVVFFETSDAERSYLESHLTDLPLRFVAEPFSEQTAAQARDASVISCFVYSRATPTVLERVPSLRLIATRSTGFDHVDLDYCAQHGIAVANVPRYGENTVAEHTFGLILTLSRKIHQAYQRALAGSFSPEGLMGFDLKDKTLGVVGAGSIGLHVIRIGRGFGMRVLAFDQRPQPLLAEVLGFEYASLEDLLAQADVISLHVPSLPSTYHLVDRSRLEHVKRGAILVNTARGSIVDTEALLWALDEGILAGAGLDVLEGEEYLQEEVAALRSPQLSETLRHLVYGHTLLRRPNVVYTPHIAFNSREALQRILDTTVENIRAFLDGRPQNLVSLRPSA